MIARRGLFAAAVAAMLAAAPGESRALQTVLPAHPGQNKVRWWEFDWKETGFSPVPGGAPVRLFFYETERNIAELAQSAISRAYRDHVERFDYRPTKTIPFLLYNSHAEFSSTTAFFISEGTLGVTSTEDLRMALPYWGENLRFRHVMRHELAHQFTIQKVVDAGKAKGCNPLMLMPLWFIEGIAEFSSLPSLTPEVLAALADVELKAPGEKQKLPTFFQEGPGTFERIYLMGHAQVRFLEETFGAGTMRTLLARTPEMCAPGTQAGFSQPSPGADFEALVARVTGASVEELEKRWRAYVEEKVAPARAARTGFDRLEVLKDLGLGEIDSFAVSPDGRTLFFRTFDQDTGVSRLFLRDESDARSLQRVDEDHRLGMETFHPLDRRVTAVGDDTLAYVGRSGANDKLFVRKYRRTEKGGRVRFSVHDGARHNLAKINELIEGGDPAIDPATGAVAFVGLSRQSGFLDIYRVDDSLKGDAPIVQLTNDLYAESGLAYAPGSVLLFASDRTEDGHHEIARLQDGRPQLLTRVEGEVDAAAPFSTGEGSFLFQSDLGGRLQAFELGPRGLTRQTDVPTSLSAPQLDAQGNLLGIARIGGKRRLVRLPKNLRLHEPVTVPEAPRPQTWSVAPATLGEVRDYNPFKNLKLAGLGAAVSGSAVGAGQLAFTDPFRSRIIGFGASFTGSLDRTSAAVFYLDQSGRFTLGAMAYFENTLQIDPNAIENLDSYLMRRIGVQVLAEYPFGRYTRVEAYLAPQVQRALDYTNPFTALQQRDMGSFTSLEGGLRFAMDTTRLTLVGPAGGSSSTLNVQGTLPFSETTSYGHATVELQSARALVHGSERFVLRGRLAGGASFGGFFAEQFYLPAAFNLRAYREGDLRLLGLDYYLGQLELHFPLGPPIAQVIYLQGVLGVDAGAIFFDRSMGWDSRVASAQGGVDFALGGFILRFQTARALDIGAGIPSDLWLFHFAFMTPMGALF